MREFVLRNVGVFFACWYLWLPITFWFGRVFCRFCCPLGLLQSLVNFVFHPKSHVRRVCANLPRPWFQLAVNWVVVLAYFFAPIGYLLNPWGIFGRGVLASFTPGIVLLAAVLLLSVFGRGRIWCNWICPLGTVFDAVARLGWKREKVIGSCRNCRRCFGN